MGEARKLKPAPGHVQVPAAMNPGIPLPTDACWQRNHTGVSHDTVYFFKGERDVGEVTGFPSKWETKNPENADQVQTSGLMGLGVHTRHIGRTTMMGDLPTRSQACGDGNGFRISNIRRGQTNRDDATPWARLISQRAAAVIKRKQDLMLFLGENRHPT